MLFANARSCIPAAVCVGLRDWPGKATCAHDPVHDLVTVGRCRNNSAPGFEWSVAVARNNRADHSMGRVKDLLLRDHAPGRQRLALRVWIWTWLAAAVLVRRPHAWIALARSHDDVADAWPLATAEVHADTRDPDSSVDSSVLPDKSDRTPSEDICAAVTAAVWNGRCWLI